MSLSDSDEDDWLTKDENELVAELHNKIEISSRHVMETETISQPIPDDLFLYQVKASQTKDAKCNSRKGHTIAVDKLKKLCQMDALDLFLHIHTRDEPFNVYLGQQIAPNDSKKRVLLYLQLLAKVCALELKGFQYEFLEFFASDDVLLQNIHFLMETLLKKPNGQWTNENEIDEFIDNSQRLLLQAYQARVLDENGLKLLMTLRRIINDSRAEEVLKRPVCLEFAKQLNLINSEADNEQQVQREPLEIYPSIIELNVEDTVARNALTPNRTFESTAAYIQQQMSVLREDFMISLRACVQSFKQNHNLENMPKQKLWMDVQIVLNPEMDLKRHEMIFIKIQCSPCKQFMNIKVGALLCLTTNYELDNLVLATVTYTPLSKLKKGYIGIEIVRQYNIGNIYEKNMFMFETPAFFEPYRNVYNYLSNCNIQDFPMQNYIVFGETATKPPAYVTSDTIYHFDKYKWAPLKGEELPVKPLMLDCSQRNAFKHAIRNDLTIIQGPPGTGKTHLSVQIVKTLVQNLKRTSDTNVKTPIVIITYTNDSLDKFLLKLSQNTDASMYRFGSQTTLPAIKKFLVPQACDGGIVNPALKRLYYTTNLEMKVAFERLQNIHKEFDGSEESYQIILKAQNVLRNIQEKLDTIRVMFQYYLAREKSIIAMTTTFAAKTNYLFRFLRSSIVIFEEAAEILESHVLACLTPYTQHVIMIGDHMQLQPYTSSYEHSRSCELNVSLFERFIRQGVQHVTLNVQYRMRPLIADLLCPLIYERLQNADIVETYPIVKGMRKNLFCVEHHGIEGEAHEHECSKYNLSEIILLLDLAEYLLKKGYGADDITILSPYAQQIEMFQKKLEKKKLHIKACTVDSFQGMEANIILLSLVRNNKQNEIGFLRQKNRICVALSRAKHGLFIAGNLTFFANNFKTWNEIYKKFRQADAIGDTFPYEESTVDNCKKRLQNI